METTEHPSLDEMIGALKEGHGKEQAHVEAAAGSDPKPEPNEAGDGSEAAKQAQVPEGEPEGKVTQDSNDQPEWLAALPEAARTEYLDARARVRQYEDDLAKERRERATMQGRLAPVQRALSQREQEVNRLQEELRNRAAPTAPAAATMSVDDLNDVFTSDDWQQWANDFPTEAKAMKDALMRTAGHSEARYKQIEKELESLRPQFGQMNERLERIVIAEEASKLASAHPDYQQIDQSREFWGWFEAYKQEQPPEYRRMLDDREWLGRQFQGSEFPIALLNAYKRDLYIANQAAEPAPVAVETEKSKPMGVAARMAVAPAIKRSEAPRGSPNFDGMSDGEITAALFDELQRKKATR